MAGGCIASVFASVPALLVRILLGVWFPVPEEERRSASFLAPLIVENLVV